MRYLRFLNKEAQNPRGRTGSAPAARGPVPPMPPPLAAASAAPVVLPASGIAGSAGTSVRCVIPRGSASVGVPPGTAGCDGAAICDDPAGRGAGCGAGSDSSESCVSSSSLAYSAGTAAA